MKGTYFMKTNHLSWKYTIVVIVFGFYLTSCADNSTTPVPKTEYPTKIVGRWQGTGRILRRRLDTGARQRALA